MKKSLQGLRLIFFMSLLILMISPAPVWGEEMLQTSLIMAGSGSNLPIIRVLAQAFMKKHPDIAIEVPTSIGSTSGIRAVADNAIAIGLISRSLKKHEKELGLEVVIYAHTPLIIGVHPGVTEENITYAGIIDIYRGMKNRWKDGKEIIVLTREPGDSTIEVMTKEVPGFKEVYDESQRAKRWTTLFKDLEMDETLAKTPDAIGFTDLCSLTIERHRIKALKVKNVAPTLKNLENNTYPLVKPLAFVFHREKLPTAARDFLAFVHSREGAKILRDNGCLPKE